MKSRLVAMSLLAIGAPLLAHDFWIQPLRFQAVPGAPFPASFQVGHGASRQRWDANDRILFLYDFFPGLKRDLRGDLKTNSVADLVTSFKAPGLHVIGMQSSYAFSELPAIRFNDYAKAEGLALTLAARQRLGSSNMTGRERYSRRAKALIQVGEQAHTNQSLATRPLGLKLEIVPERNPYALGAGRILPVYVLYNGHRLPGATVKLTSLEFDARPLAAAVTDRAGRASFRVPAVGEWLVNVIWSEPLNGDPKADFDTTFSSLTFGYDPAKRQR